MVDIITIGILGVLVVINDRTCVNNGSLVIDIYLEFLAYYQARTRGCGNVYGRNFLYGYGSSFFPILNGFTSGCNSIGYTGYGYVFDYSGNKNLVGIGPYAGVNLLTGG